MSDALGFKLEMEGAVAVLRLDRPKRKNAIDVETCRGMIRFVRAARLDPAIRAILITGVDDNFCTGADAVQNNDAVKANGPLDYRWLTADFNELFLSLWETDVPVVSAVNGRVAGAGWLLALLADLVVAAEGARWTHVYLRRGMVPHAGDPYFLTRLLPLQRINEIAMLGDPISSETLFGWGVVNRVVPSAEVMTTAMQLAQRLASGPTRSIGMAKRLYRRALDSDVTTAFEEERAALALISTTSDRLEGVQSFIEGRPPEFTGN